MLSQKGVELQKACERSEGKFSRDDAYLTTIEVSENILNDLIRTVMTSSY